MKSFFVSLLFVSFLLSVPALHQRWQGEHRTRPIELIVDAQEVSQLTSRPGLTASQWIEAVAAQGVGGILTAPQTLAEVTLTPRIVAELQKRGVSNPSRRSPQSLKLVDDVEVGYNPMLLDAISASHRNLYLRVSHDPWMSPDLTDPSLLRAQGYLFSTDPIPGGLEKADDWAVMIRNTQKSILLFEFRPTKASLEMSARLPSSVIRGHTIPTPELKDLLPNVEIARWLRAVEERSCTLLFIRPGVSESWSEFLDRIGHIRDALIFAGWKVGSSVEVSTEQPSRPLLLKLRLLLAWGIAVVVPLLALAVGWTCIQRGKSGLTAFFFTLGVTVIGGLVVAAVSWMPETRLQLSPFRGVKAAMIFPWILSGLVLYSWHDLKVFVQKPLRRGDVLIALLLLGIAGYSLLRSGNASPTWKPSAEQGLRNYLEKKLTVRPRFKEFAVGVPLLCVGYLLAGRRKKKRIAMDPRPVLWLGMMGPVSIVNTFCHLHSPLALALGRTGMGILLGTFLGVILYTFYHRAEGWIYETK